MSADVTVSIAQPQQAVVRVLGEVSRRHGDELLLTSDYYWTLTPEATDDVYASPSADDVTMGQLSDDLETLHGMSSESYDVHPWHDLAHLIGILQRIAAQDRP